MIRGAYKQDKYFAAKKLFLEGGSLRRVADAVGVSKRTALSWRNEMFQGGDIKCQCGLSAKHQGWCQWRINQSPARQMFLARCAAQSAETQKKYNAERAVRIAQRAAQRQERRLYRELQLKKHKSHQHKRRVAVEPVTVAYPYFHKGGEDHGLVLRVNEIVPRYLPYQIRADVCQEILLAIIDGELLEDNAPAELPKYVTHILNQQQDRWKEIPIDAPVRFQDGDAHTLADCMSAEDYADRLKNAWEANRLLTPTKRTQGIHIADRKTDYRKTKQLQASGFGRMKMTSYIRHPGHDKIDPRNYMPKTHGRMRDELIFTTREYQERRAEEDRKDIEAA